MSDGPTSFAPGWYPDPTGRHTHRWYDGARWTDHVGDGGRSSIDPLGQAAGEVARERPGRSSAFRLLAIGFGALAVLVVALFAWAIWLVTSGRGPAGDAFERYTECLETRDAAECEAELQSLLLERLAPTGPAD